MPLALIAHIVLWGLLAASAMQAGWRRPIAFAVLWAVGYVASGWLPFTAGFLFGSFVAVLDTVLLILIKLDAVR